MTNDALRARIEGLLGAGLGTEWADRAYMPNQVTAACRRLQDLAPDDVEARLVVAGFTPQPYVAPVDEGGIEQSCSVCMYFDRHRAFCALPELMLPVEPQWSCILWRI